MRPALQRTILLLCSTAAGLLIVEGGARLLESRDDSAWTFRRVHDPALELRMPANQFGHDANGFRNDRVRDRVDIVTLGDSQTWGMNVRRHEAWPQQLETLSGRSVYNMGMVGWGPAQYWALMPRIQAFRPGIVVVQLYLGNDYWDAYRASYSLDAFASWRQPGAPADFAGGPTPPGVTAGAAREAVWMKPGGFWGRPALQRFALGRLFVPRLEERRSNAIAETWGRDHPEDVVTYAHNSVRTVLAIPRRLAELDRSDPRLAEGARLTMAYLQDIARRITDAHLVILIFPTKAAAFKHAVVADRAMSPALAQLIRAEDDARATIAAWCQSSSLVCVDPLEAFQAAVRQDVVVFGESSDVHPNTQGYRIVAQAVSDAIGRRGW